MRRSGTPFLPSTAGTRPRWTRRTSDGVSFSDGNAEFASATSVSTSALVTPVSSGCANVADWLVPTSARPRQGTSVSMRPCFVAEPDLT